MATNNSDHKGLPIKSAPAQRWQCDGKVLRAHCKGNGGGEIFKVEPWPASTVRRVGKVGRKLDKKSAVPGLAQRLRTGWFLDYLVPTTEGADPSDYRPPVSLLSGSEQVWSRLTEGKKRIYSLPKPSFSISS
jgi:hypothetical protein